MREILRQKMIEGLSALPPAHTHRSVWLPRVPRKGIAVTGVRRSGKTTFLWQCLADRLTAGAPRESLLLLGIEDDRIIGVQAADMSWLVEEYYALHPHFRDTRTVTFFLDEIQLVSGWEVFVRRLMDTEKIDLFLSGSSAKLLSREVATSMRGRAIETTMYPFSFREALRHTGDEPARPWMRLTKAARSLLDHRLRRYLAEGGFPEAQNLPTRDRLALLSSYVDVMVLRDVIERNAISNPVALRWMQRQLLASPAAPFSIEKLHSALRSQGIPVGKDSLHAYLAHLEDAFLIATVSLHTDSERKRMVHPRKAYPIDPGFIPLFERMGSPNTGQALETVVLLELLRRGYQVGYVTTAEGWEVDFYAHAPGRKSLLLQVTASLHDPATRERETRALISAASLYPQAIVLLISLDGALPGAALPAPLRWMPATRWLLEDEDQG